MSSSKKLISNVDAIVWDCRVGNLTADEAKERIMQLFERDGEKARSSVWLARRVAEKGLGNNETGKASSDVSPHRCPACVSRNVHVTLSHMHCNDCGYFMGWDIAQRRYEVAERRANSEINRN